MNRMAKYKNSCNLLTFKKREEFEGSMNFVFLDIPGLFQCFWWDSP